MDTQVLLGRTKFEAIVGSMLISIVARRALSLGEFMEGLDVYGLKDIIFKNQDACRSLFVKGKIEEVDANLLDWASETSVFRGRKQ